MRNVAPPSRTIPAAARLSDTLGALVAIGDQLRPRLLAREHRDGLALEVDVGLAGDVDRHAIDRAAGERPGRLAGVVARDGVAAVAPDAQALAADRELARLG